MGRRERDPYESATRCEECGLRDPGEWHECKRCPPGVPEVIPTTGRASSVSAARGTTTKRA